MNKRYLVLIFLAFLSLQFHAIAQPVLDSIEDYSIGETRSYVVLEGNPVQDIPTGEDTTWNYSTLKPIEDTILQHIVSPEESTHGGNYTDADFAEIQANGLEYYVQRLGDTNQLLGNYQEEFDGGIEITYTEPFPMYKRPFAYTDTVADSGRRSYEIESIGATYEGTGHSRTHAIGWGTLVLPQDTFEEVVLVKNYQEWNDEGDLGSIYNEIVSYRWYHPDSAQYLLSIDTFLLRNAFLGDGDSVIVNAQYYTQGSSSITSVSELGKEKEGKPWLKTFASKDQLVIQSLTGELTAVNLAIYDRAGRKIKAFDEFPLSADRKHLNISGLKPGVYLIQGRIGNAQGQLKRYTGKIMLH